MRKTILAIASLTSVLAAAPALTLAGTTSSTTGSTTTSTSTAASPSGSGSTSSSTWGSTVYSTVWHDVGDQYTTFTVPASLSTTEQDVQSSLHWQPYIQELVSQIGYSSSGSNTTVTVKWLQSRAQTTALDASIHQVLGQITSSGMSDYDKEFAIHNWIVNHVTYDTSYTKYTPYDAFYGKSAVCQGIATLSYRMLTFAGIPTRLVPGTASGASHLWNEVLVGGRWYQLDVTWDDPVNKQPGTVSYQYYNVTDATLANDHSWNHTGLPAATTDFAQVLKQLLPVTTDAGLKQIASATGILASLNSPVVTAQNLGQVMQSELNQKKTQFTLEFEGTMTQAQSALNGLSLYGFTSLQYGIQSGRQAGTQLITVTATY